MLPIAGIGLAATSVGPVAFFGTDSLNIYDANTGQWTTAAMPHGDRKSATSIGTKALFTGGSPGDPTLSTVDIYDLRTRQWSTARLALPSEAGAITTGNRAIIDTGSIEVFDVYDATTGLSSTLPTIGTGGAFTAVGSELIFPAFGRINALDVLTRKFSAIPFQPGSGGVEPAIAVGTKAMFYVGQFGNLFIYDTVTRRGSVVNPPPGLGIGGDAVTHLGTKALFAEAGGDLTIYDTSTGQWSTAPISTPRVHMAATTVGKQALFAGGELNYFAFYNPLNNVDIYTDQTPIAVLSGDIATRAKGKATVTVYNTGDADLAGPYTVNVYASPPHRLTGAVFLGSVRVAGGLAAGASARVFVPTNLPRNMPIGTYHFVAAVATADGKLTPIASASDSFSISPPRGLKFGHAG